MIQAPLALLAQTANGTSLDPTRFIESVTGFGPEFQRKLILASFVVLSIVVLRRVVLQLAERRYDDPRVRYRWSKVTGYVAFGLGFVLVLNLVVGTISSLGTFLGLLTAGLAIALRDLVTNLAGWLFILVRRPFDVGDRIQIAGHAGDVVDRRIFQFTLLEIGNWVDADQSTGRIIHIPNQKVFTEPLANYTAQFEYLWNEISVLVTFESDWRRAKGILEGIAQREVGGLAADAESAVKRAARHFLIFYRKLTPVVYTTVKASGVELTLRYLCLPRQRRGTQQAVWEAVLDAFALEPTVELAYPTTRIYMNPEINPGRSETSSET